MTSRKPAPAATSLAMAPLERLAVCRDQLKMAADQLAQGGGSASQKRKFQMRSRESRKITVTQQAPASC